MSSTKTLTDERRMELFNQMIEALMENIPADKLICAIRTSDSDDWMKVFQHEDDANGEISSPAAYILWEQTTHDELVELAKPHLEYVLQKALGAKEVTIVWNTNQDEEE